MFVPTYVLRIFHSQLQHATLVPVHPDSILELSIKKDISPGLSMCLLTPFAPSSLLLTKGAMLLGKGSGSTHSVYSVPVTVLMWVTSAIVPASHYPSVFFTMLMGLNQSSFPSTSSPACACSSLSRRFIGRMSFVGFNHAAASRLYQYLHSRLLSRESAGRRHAYRATIIFGAVLNIPITAHPCLWISFWYYSH